MLIKMFSAESVNDLFSELRGNYEKSEFIKDVTTVGPAVATGPLVLSRQSCKAATVNSYH